MDLAGFLKPQYYDAFTASALEIRKKNKQMALTLGHYIKQIAVLNIGEAIRESNSIKKNATEDFLLLFNGSWNSTVAASTVRMQRLAQLAKKHDLPTTADLIKLTNFVKQEIAGEVASSSAKYSRLQKLVATALILFNKQRPAEVIHLKMADYRLGIENTDDQDEIVQTLSPEEKAVASR